MARSYLLLLSGIVALLLGIATTVLLFILAASLGGPAQPSPTLPLVAGIVQALSLLIWAFLVWRQSRADARFQLRGQKGFEKGPVLLVFGVGVVPVVIAAVITGTTLGWSQGNLKVEMRISSLSAPTFLTVIFIVWGITLATQVTHLISTACFRKPHARPSHQRFSMGEGLSSGETGPSQQVTELRRPETAATQGSHQSNPFRDTPSSSSPPSLIPSEGPSSLRSSFSTLPRPSSSKRSLIIRQPSFGLKHPQASVETQPSLPDGLLGRPSHDEGFDSWDTSQVSLQIREALQATAKHPPAKETRLAPIPGSRSPSPAKVLEGPFFDQTPSDDTPPMSPLPQPSVSRPSSPPSSSPAVPNFTSIFPAAAPIGSSPPASPTPAGLGLKLITAFPPSTSSNHSPLANSPVAIVTRHNSRAGSQPGSRPLSRQPSREDHIHPLFRTTSPSPAPSPSLSTVITAAPEAGQLVDERILRSRMRKGSLPTISSPLLRSESSPNIRNKAEDLPPLSAIGSIGESPPPLPRKSSNRLHQRKRSASLETFIRAASENGEAGFAVIY